MLYYFEGGVAVKKWIKCFLSVALSALMFAGCSIQTVDQMYQLPKRSADYSNLQWVMDRAMTGLSFSAPLVGDNQQSVQMADLDGDAEQEYLVLAKGNAEQPLRILVFDRTEDVFVHTDTIKSNGAAFDQIEYIQMDDKPGVEVVVGRRVSDQVVRAISVYTFSGGQAQQLVSANYRKYVTADLNDDGCMDLLVLRPGQSDTDSGIAELYRMNDGVVERANEAAMSCPTDHMKRILVGKLQDKKTAVYVACSIEDTSLVTDIFTQTGDRLVNVSLSGEAGNSMQTLRNHYVYADDMDDDGVVELPKIVKTVPIESGLEASRRDLILWYAMDSNSNMTNKRFTYYDSVGGWYLELDEKLAPMMTVHGTGNAIEFYLWNEDYSETQKLMTIHILTGQNRDEQSTINGRFVLMRTDTVTYAASLDAAAVDYTITQDNLIRSFYLIQQDWNTGET